MICCVLKGMQYLSNEIFHGVGRRQVLRRAMYRVILGEFEKFSSKEVFRAKTCWQIKIESVLWGIVESAEQWHYSYWTVLVFFSKKRMRGGEKKKHLQIVHFGLLDEIVTINCKKIIWTSIHGVICQGARYNLRLSYSEGETKHWDSNCVF